jgi:hypothetical protein
MTLSNMTSAQEMAPAKASEKEKLQRDFSRWVSATSAPEALVLGITGFSYADLHEPERLADLHALFERETQAADPEAFAAFAAYRACKGEGMTAEAVSTALLGLAPHVSRFVAKLFNVGGEVAGYRDDVSGRKPLWSFKREFVKKRVLKSGAGRAFLGRNATVADAARVSRRALFAAGAPESLIGSGSAEEENAIAEAVLAIFEVEDTGRKAAKAGGAEWTSELHARAAKLRRSIVEGDTSAIAALPELAARPAEDTTEALDAADLAVATLALDAIEMWLAARRNDHADPSHKWPTLKAPHNIDPEKLVKLRRPDEKFPELFVGPEDELRPRDGFALTDRRMKPRQIEQEIDYCLLCHDRDKDSCSKGLREAKTKALKKNGLGVTLAGCPLGEKISEMHMMRAEGDALAGLALICVDNPMLPGTGHRICNDCMKACVFQKQEPVNSPDV